MAALQPAILAPQKAALMTISARQVRMAAMAAHCGINVPDGTHWHSGVYNYIKGTSIDRRNNHERLVVPLLSARARRGGSVLGGIVVKAQSSARL